MVATTKVSANSTNDSTCSFMKLGNDIVIFVMSSSLSYLM